MSGADVTKIDTFGAKGTLEVGSNSYEIFRLSAVPGTEKLPYALKVLAENHREAAQILRDAFEDAVLMGVDEAAMRRILAEMIAALPSPKRAA